MTQFLPPNLLALFAARDPIPYLPPCEKLSWEKKTDGYTGIASFVNKFEDPKDTPPPIKVETREEKIERKRKEKAELMAYKLEQEIALWDPASLDAGTADPYKTLFIARVNYDTTESKLRREFEGYGPIKKIFIVHNKITGKPCGYAFIEYEHERDMHSAYKHADGKKIDGRRVLVDVERARTVKGWLPRRLGGGLGGTRRGGPDDNIKHSGRDDDRRKGRSESRMSREKDDRRDRRDNNNRDRRSRDRDDRRRRRRSHSQDVTYVDSVSRKRRRSRDRDEDGERRKKRSRSRDRRRRSRSRERRHRRDRDRDRKPTDLDPALQSLKIKQEPDDDYPRFPTVPIGLGNPGEEEDNYAMKDEEKFRPNGTVVKTEPVDNDADY